MNISFFNQLDIKKIFDSTRIFESTPDSQGLYRYLSIIFGLFLIIAVIFLLVSRKKKPVIQNFFNRLINWLLFTGIGGLILIFFRWQGIPYLGSRLMLYVLIITFAIWGGFIVRYRLVILPKEIAKLKAKERFEKYLPRVKAGLPKKSKGK